MAGYFGTERQCALQERTHAFRDWMAETPGIYNAGRFIGADDPDRVAWADLEAILERDRILGLRMVTADQASRFFPRLEARGYRIDTWNIFTAPAADIAERIEAILAPGLPDGLRVALPLSGPEADDTRRLQQFLADNGMAPLSGTMLASPPPVARTIMLAEANGAIAACGHAYFPHNRHSPFSRHAWVGLVAVAQAQRGRGLGRLVNAMLLDAAARELHAGHVYELVGASNTASRKMVESCGLRLADDLLCGVATPTEEGRFTH
jgi:RimJ/RimL family protein N-acetyltransferase